MEETILETFNDVKFIQGATKMNQTNWQAYFGTALPNGIYDGLMVQDYFGEANFGYPYILTDGALFVNGLMAEIKTEDGFTEIGDNEYSGTASDWAETGSTVPDRFICIRVYLKEEKAQIVKKTGIAEFTENIMDYEAATKYQLELFMTDESYCCTRNEYYWEVPIFYQCARTTSQTFGRYELFSLGLGRSLRREINLGNLPEYNPNIIGMKIMNSGESATRLISGNNGYKVKRRQLTDETWGGSVRYGVCLYMDNLNPPVGAIVEVECEPGDLIRIEGVHFANEYVKELRQLASGYGDVYYIIPDPTNWAQSYVYPRRDRFAGASYTVPEGAEYVKLRFTYMYDGILLNGDGNNTLFKTYLVEVFDDVNN